MMPPRKSWVRPSKRVKLPNGAVDTSKNAEKALLLTIERDRRRYLDDARPDYLKELDAFIAEIRGKLEADGLTLDPPRLMPILKSVKKMEDGRMEVTCRPLSTYSRLEDKVILSVTSRYLTKYVDRQLHENILSYRSARNFHGIEHHVTDFNDGVKLLKAFREEHDGQRIFAADCDIKKFYDIIPHEVVRGCFERMLDSLHLCKEGKRQVMNVVGAYLKSYNFYDNAWMEAENHKEVFFKVRRRLHDNEGGNIYRLGWVEELLKQPEEERRKVGVPQGGALSLLVANIVLNDVDHVITENDDDDRLFIRYCDDMILLHTDYNECCQLMDRYAESLTNHGLYFHEFEEVKEAKCKDTDKAECTNDHFWKIKSHKPFLWGDGTGNSNRYIGFLGYEMRCDGRMRLRKSNIERFKEKANRLHYALRRYAKKHTPEEYAQHEEKVIANLIGGVEFYEALDMKTFKQGSQYRYMKELTEKLKGEE